MNIIQVLLKQRATKTQVNIMYIISVDTEHSELRLRLRLRKIKSFDRMKVSQFMCL